MIIEVRFLNCVSVCVWRRRRTRRLTSKKPRSVKLCTGDGGGTTCYRSTGRGKRAQEIERRNHHEARGTQERAPAAEIREIEPDGERPSPPTHRIPPSTTVGWGLGSGLPPKIIDNRQSCDPNSLDAKRAEWRRSEVEKRNTVKQGQEGPRFRIHPRKPDAANPLVMWRHIAPGGPSSSRAIPRAGLANPLLQHETRKVYIGTDNQIWLQTMPTRTRAVRKTFEYSGALERNSVEKAAGNSCAPKVGTVLDSAGIGEQRYRTIPLPFQEVGPTHIKHSAGFNECGVHWAQFIRVGGGCTREQSSRAPTLGVNCVCVWGSKPRTHGRAAKESRKWFPVLEEVRPQRGPQLVQWWTRK
ncbi:hypothetical protein BJ322DRAFT_1220204 [Thelephora terrestris]|uniref:Uncharacterized protein n=1 Tax=Thelephora terrestris TaxID=56493 RepID=A0A9P6HAP3_9AGAM|nr:hypothetical protein BJ322DRAFT_1220204 [Thelephora terrestris]